VESNTNKKKIKKIAGIIGNTFIWVFVAFSVLITVLVFSSQGSADGIPALFGKSLLTIQTSSMEKTYGVGDMLVQNRQDVIHFLAALPENWGRGSINGIVARGNFVIDMAWANRVPVSITVTSKVGGRCRLALPADRQVLSNGVVVPTTYENGILSFDTTAGTTYHIH
jgi:hypothetical protein